MVPPLPHKAGPTCQRYGPGVHEDMHLVNACPCPIQHLTLDDTCFLNAKPCVPCCTHALKNSRDSLPSHASAMWHIAEV
eukprot:scaffold65992_cov19-Tisochrysis_lutea.AAC.1